MVTKSALLEFEASINTIEKMKNASPRKIIFIGCALVGLSSGLCHGRSASPAAVPLLDEMSGTWLPMKDVANPPDVNNFHDMLLVNRDLTSFFCNPEDWLWGGADEVWHAGYPLVTLTIAGKEYIYYCQDRKDGP